MSCMLIADDNQQLLQVLTDAAQKQGFTVLQATDGQQAVELFEKNSIQIALLDVMMPKLDGFAVCRQIRSKSDLPIIMITARGEDFEKIMGLDIGADDYIVKPCSPAEVMARVCAVLRRVQAAGPADGKQLQVDTLSINLNDYTVRVSGQQIALTKREVDLLFTLAQCRNRAFTREMLLYQLWGYDYYGDPRTVDSHIKRLRAKLDAVWHPGWKIATIRNVGYRFEVQDER